ncbi:GSCFA domain-containing protein [Flavobacterium sp.]|uniref:GSCFA domain-containing protein n=1 Tax=Flavobacterium sp. TaxID=239 RepID=UPI003C44113D
MNFRLQIPISNSDFPIDYHSKIMSLGSCFAVNMSDKFNYYKFGNSCNPFGIIFNPVSIEKLIQRCVNKDYFTDAAIFFHNDLWHCFEVHSELSNPNKEALLFDLNTILDGFYKNISEATHCIITLGTAWVYRNLESNEIVANCHKVPQKQFSKEILSVETIQNAIQNSIETIRKINPNCNFIFTVSPVRHIKDGFVENTLSKAHLITAIHQVVTLNWSKCFYFPSYEIMMDELRDYRFYTPDMLHPNSVAVDYIWERFTESNMSEKTFVTMKEIGSIQSGLQHRSFNPESESHQQFLAKLHYRMAILQKQFPQISF